jgi:3-hydroxyisobutyrate dehydrogenase-like beta-hydroxyacid dehydrogenase
MGAAMARKLAAAGRELVLWNRDRSKAEAVARDTSGEVVDTAAEAAARAPVVISSLADDTALESVYLGPDGLADGVRAGALVLDTSTVDPDTAVRVGDAIDAAGADFLDCPVSGSVATIESGALVVMAGGIPSLVDRARPVFEPLAKQVVRAGERGAGAACKLAVNAFLHGLNVALSEALVLAEKAGVDRLTAYEVFASGAAGAPFVHYKRAAYEHPEEAQTAFSLDLVAKDLDLITGLASRVGAPMDQAHMGLDIVRRAVRAGLGGRDLSAVAVYLRQEES